MPPEVTKIVASPQMWACVLGNAFPVSSRTLWIVKFTGGLRHGKKLSPSQPDSDDPYLDAPRTIEPNLGRHVGLPL